MSNITPLDISPWVTRIKANCPAVKFAGRAAHYTSAIELGPKVTPAAYVLEPSYTPIGVPNYSGNVISQMLEFRVPVLIATFNYADATGADAANDVHTAREQIWNALIGWKPITDGFTVSALTGNLLYFKDQFLYYLDTYQLQVNIRNI